MRPSHGIDGVPPYVLYNRGRFGIASIDLQKSDDYQKTAYRRRRLPS